MQGEYKCLVEETHTPTHVIQRAFFGVHALGRTKNEEVSRVMHVTLDYVNSKFVEAELQGGPVITTVSTYHSARDMWISPDLCAPSQPCSEWRPHFAVIHSDRRGCHHTAILAATTPARCDRQMESSTPPLRRFLKLLDA